MLKLVLLRGSADSTTEKLEAIRAAARHHFPVGDMSNMLSEIEAGYVSDENHSDSVAKGQ